MTRRRFLARVDAPRVEKAIRQAEQRSNIEVRVSVAGLFWGDPQRVAEQAFRRLGMSGTAGRNGILLLIVPWRRKVVVVADEGITSKIESAFWQTVVATVTTAFRSAHYTEGLVDAIDGLSRSLAPLFPPHPSDTNELPDAIDRGG
jgi:uncharacterized membrane protein